MSHTIAISGGHLTPALAVIELLRTHNFRIIYINDESPLYQEASIVMQNLGIKTYSIAFAKWHRHSLFQSLINLALFPKSLYIIRKILQTENVDVSLSFGGYQSVPLIIISKLLNIPSITHEQTLVPGLANKLNSYLVNYVAVTNEIASRNFPGHKTVITGNPIRSQIIANIHRRQPTNNVIYITGGHLGSKILNSNFLEIHSELLSRYTVYHSIGNHPHQAIAWQDAQQLATQFPNYHPKKYFSADELSGIMAQVSLIISRAGANTCWEIARWNVPSILIPLPTGQKNEQLKNAELLKHLGLAVIIDEQNLTPDLLLNEITQTMNNLPKYQISTQDQDKYYPLDGDKKLYKLIEDLCTK